MADVETVGVLVVEDDPLVMLAAVDVIEHAGYRVYQASDADAAIRLLEAHDAIHILFTDIEMPGSMDGLELAACIRDRWPKISIIITSGRILARDVGLPAGDIFLAKPYGAQELTDRLEAFS